MTLFKFDGKVLQDLKGNRIGSFNGKTFLDHRGNRRGSISGGKLIRDKDGAKAASFNGKSVLSAQGERIATASDITNAISGELDLVHAALWYFFVYEPTKEKRKEQHLNFIG